MCYNPYRIERGERVATLALTRRGSSAIPNALCLRFNLPNFHNTITVSDEGIHIIPHAEKLIEKAQKGEKLTTAERRHCIGFLIATERPTNQQMGTLFKVSERQVRLDKEHIRKERAREITDEDISLVISDIAMVFETQIRDIEKSKRKCKMGGRAYLEHCKTIFKAQLDKVKALQDLGFYPKNLGQMTVQRYEYAAIVSKDGSVETRPTELSFEDVEIVEAQKALPAPEERDTSEFET